MYKTYKSVNSTKDFFEWTTNIGMCLPRPKYNR